MSALHRSAAGQAALAYTYLPGNASREQLDAVMRSVLANIRRVMDDVRVVTGNDTFRDMYRL